MDASDQQPNTSAGDSNDGIGPSRRQMFKVAGAALAPAIITLRARTAHAADYSISHYVYGTWAPQNNGGTKFYKGPTPGTVRDEHGNVLPT